MTDKNPTVELIMVTWNTPETIQQSIPSILNNTNHKDYHLTVIDNASHDNTWTTIQELCYQYKDKIDAYQTHINKGYGTACNIGAKLTKPEYYCFLNSDVFVYKDSEDWLTTLIQTFKDEEDVGAVAPKLLNFEDKVFGHAVLGNNKDNDLTWYWGHPDGSRYNKLLDAVTLCGAAIMIPYKLFWMMNGFDERFFHYYEEKDIIYRLRREGYRAVCNPKSVLVHEHMGSCDNQNLLAVYEFIGKELFELKHKEFIEDPTKFEEE